MNRIDLNDDDVVSMSEEDNLLDGQTSKISEIMSKIMNVLDRHHQTEICEKWVESGVDCQLLQVQGGGWKKGKIRIRLEFVSNEEQSSPKGTDRLGSELDEFRTKLN
ncbi:hypothetical protein OGM63_16555 [Plectonema radiosum NIES-515]|uniref:KGK family protein n=1 Tax=Plectonema radiosum NIES-515 TaxID=2986073 RepID=A0ABT3B158_9CYAN|nr:KGK domain-containing protein [Plectonema radiosum]MCV3215104.1 hypothetical protein [Plectonema radiosum NIES-515]